MAKTIPGGPNGCPSHSQERAVAWKARKQHTLSDSAVAEMLAGFQCFDNPAKVARLRAKAKKLRCLAWFDAMLAGATGRPGDGLRLQHTVSVVAPLARILDAASDDIRSRAGSLARTMATGPTE